MAEIKWIKIVTDIFDNRKIKQIESLPDGDTIIVIWFKLLCLAGVINDNGSIYITQEIPYTEETLATQFNRPLATIQLAMKTFQAFGMIEVINDVLHISNWENYQNIEGMEKIREQTRKRVAKHRKNQRLKLKSGNANVTLHVTQSNATDKNRIDKNNIYIVEIVNYLNSVSGKNFSSTTQNTIKHINARLEEGFTVDDFKTVIDTKCEEWSGTDMAKYIRPDTLFGTKFESYLNQEDASKPHMVFEDGVFIIK